MTEQHRIPEKKLLLRVSYVLLVLGCIGGSLWFHYFRTPEGLFYDKYLASTGPTYWFLEDGSVNLRVRAADQESGWRTTVTGASYVNSEGDWIMRNHPDEPELVLKPSLVGLKVICREDPNSHWNRFLPRRGFSWLFRERSTEQ